MEVAKATNNVRVPVSKQIDQYIDEVEQEKLYKVKLYIYPEWQNPIAIFDEDELLNTQAMMVLCARA